MENQEEDHLVQYCQQYSTTTTADGGQSSELTLQEPEEYKKTNDSPCHDPLHHSNQESLSFASDSSHIAKSRAVWTKDGIQKPVKPKTTITNSSSRDNIEVMSDVLSPPSTSGAALRSNSHHQDDQTSSSRPFGAMHEKAEGHGTARKRHKILRTSQEQSYKIATTSIKRKASLPVSSDDTTKRKSLHNLELLDQSETDLSQIASGINLGRRGDPRMHKAVSVRLANPSLSLLDALIEGGFQFPCHELAASSGKSDRDILDEEGVQLCQRKNQLSRRLRLIRKKREDRRLENGTSLFGSDNSNFRNKDNFPTHEMKPLAAVPKINPFPGRDDACYQEGGHYPGVAPAIAVQEQEQKLHSTSGQHPLYKEHQKQQQQLMTEHKQQLQNYTGWLPPAVFPSFTASIDSMNRSRTDNFTRSSSYPPQQSRQYLPEINTYSSSSTRPRNLIDLLQENQGAQANIEGILLDFIKGKPDAQWNNSTNSLTGALNIGQPIYSPATTTQFLGSSYHSNPLSGITPPNTSSSTLEQAFCTRPGTQPSLHQLLQESTVIGKHDSSFSNEEEQERYLSTLVATAMTSPHNQNYGLSVPTTSTNNQPAFAPTSTNRLRMSASSTTSNDLISPQHPAALQNTNLQQSINDDRNNMFLTNDKLSMPPPPGIMQQAAPTTIDNHHHHDSILATSIIGQLAFDEKLTLAVEIYKSLRKGLVMECLKRAGFTQGDVIDNNELFLLLFERKLKASSQADRGAASSGEERSATEAEDEQLLQKDGRQ